jgi:hypothetical protein
LLLFRKETEKYFVKLKICVPLIEFLGSAMRTSKLWPKRVLVYCELKHPNPWFDEKYSKLAYRRKQAKLHWLQDTSKVEEENLCIVGQEASRRFRKKKREFLKERFNELNQIVRTSTSEICMGA